MQKKLAHIGIAVKSLAASVPVYSKLFPVEEVEIEEVRDQGVRVAFFKAENCSLELTEATTDTSPVGKFIDKRGEGVHHLSFEVDDLEAELGRLSADGFKLIDEKPRAGAGGALIAFLHPSSTNGVLIELCQKPGER